MRAPDSKARERLAAQQARAHGAGDQRFGHETAAELLGERAEGPHAQPGAAFRFGDAQARPAERADLAPHRGVEAGMLEAQRAHSPEVAAARRDRAGAVADQPDRLVVLPVHGRSVEGQRDGLRDQSRACLALDLHRRIHHEAAAALHRLAGLERQPRAEARAGRHGIREAHLVRAVIDAARALADAGTRPAPGVAAARA